MGGGDDHVRAHQRAAAELRRGVVRLRGPEQRHLERVVAGAGDGAADDARLDEADELLARHAGASVPIARRFCAATREVTKSRIQFDWSAGCAAAGATRLPATKRARAKAAGDASLVYHFDPHRLLGANHTGRSRGRRTHCPELDPTGNNHSQCHGAIKKAGQRKIRTGPRHPTHRRAIRPMRRKCWLSRRQLSGFAARALLAVEMALRLQRVGDLLRHVALVVLGEDLARDEGAALHPPGGDHPLALAEEVGRDAGEDDGQAGAAVGDREAHLAAVAHHRALGHEPAEAEPLALPRRLARRAGSGCGRTRSRRAWRSRRAPWPPRAAPRRR